MLRGNNETYATRVNDIIIKRIEPILLCVPGTQPERISDSIIEVPDKTMSLY
jgi:hypothetical protein